MALASKPQKMTVEEFLVWHEEQDVRHELIDGIPYPKHATWTAMAGAELAHGLVCNNVSAAITGPVVERGCEVLGPDAAVRTAIDQIRYPDLTVTCSDEIEGYEVVDPKLVVEVLSRSTKLYDLRDKRAEYQRLASLLYILFVDPVLKRAKLHSREPGENWTSQIYFEPEHRIEMPLIGASITLATMLRRVPGEWPATKGNMTEATMWLDD